jgi:small subunit ribosomal protein S13e
MGRMYGRGKGISKSSIPYKKKAPRWLTVDTNEVVKQIEALAKKGYKPSQIGVILRDNYAIPQSALLTGAKILRLLKKKGIAPEIPEDLYHLMRKAVQIRKHIEKNKRDRDSKFRLILVESKIHRLV